MKRKLMSTKKKQESRAVAREPRRAMPQLLLFVTAELCI